MTPKQYTFAKNTRLFMIVVSATVLIFFAGAVFTGYKPNASNYLVMFLAVGNLISFTFNKPTPPSTL